MSQKIKLYFRISKAIVTYYIVKCLKTKTGTLTPFVLFFLTWLQIYSWFVMDFSAREESFFFIFFFLGFCHFPFLFEVFEFSSVFSFFPRHLHFAAAGGSCLPTLGATDAILEAADTDLASWWRRESDLRTLRWVSNTLAPMHAASCLSTETK